MGLCFEGAISHDETGIVVMAWRGHIDASGLRDHLTALDALAQSLELAWLLIDATLVSGYDLDARTHARAWARADVAKALRAVAIVAESSLTAAESPALVLAPPRIARLFASIHPARSWLQQVATTRSGEYHVGDVRHRVVANR